MTIVIFLKIATSNLSLICNRSNLLLGGVVVASLTYRKTSLLASSGDINTYLDGRDTALDIRVYLSYDLYLYVQTYNYI